MRNSVFLAIYFKYYPFYKQWEFWTAGAGLLEYMFFQINNGIFPFLMLGLVGMFGLFSGRIFCGWVCPTGFISDLFSGLAGSNKRLSIKADKTMKKFKLLLLIVMFLLFLPLGFYEVYDPNNYANYSAALGNLLSNPVGPFSLSEFLFVSIPNLVKAGMNGLNFASFFNDNAGTITLFIIYCIIIAIIVYYPRFYCKYICPYAALVGIFSEYSFLRLSRLPTRCPGRKDCGKCETVCPMQIRILDEPYEGFTGGGECILCLDCMQSCPEDAIKWKFGL